MITCWIISYDPMVLYNKLIYIYIYIDIERERESIVGVIWIVFLTIPNKYMNLT